MYYESQILQVGSANIVARLFSTTYSYSYINCETKVVNKVKCDTQCFNLETKVRRNCDWFRINNLQALLPILGRLAAESKELGFAI